MDDAAVVGARIEPRTWMPLEHADRQFTPGDGPRRGQPRYAGANHCYANSFHIEICRIMRLQISDCRFQIQFQIGLFRLI